MTVTFSTRALEGSCKSDFFQRALDCAKAARCLRFIVFMEP